VPRTDAEVLFAVLFIFVGAGMFSYVTGTLASLVSSSDRKESAYRQKINLLLRFLNERRDFVSSHVRSYLINQLAVAWSSDQEITTTEEYFRDLLPYVPDGLRYELAFAMFKPILEQKAAECSSFLNLLHDHRQMLIGIAEQGYALTFLTSSLLAVKQKPIDRIYIVQRGAVHCVSQPSSQQVLYTYEQGDVIGLPALAGVPDWYCCLRAARVTLVWVVSLRDFLQLLSVNLLREKAAAAALDSWRELSHVLPPDSAVQQPGVVDGEELWEVGDSDDDSVSQIDRRVTSSAGLRDRSVRNSRTSSAGGAIITDHQLTPPQHASSLEQRQLDSIFTNLAQLNAAVRQLSERILAQQR